MTEKPLTDAEVKALREILERERTISTGMKWLRVFLGWLILVGGVIATWGPIKDVIKVVLK